MKDYIENATITESKDFKDISPRLKEGNVTNELHGSMLSIIALGQDLDKLKKYIFYGKNTGIPSFPDANYDSVTLEKLTQNRNIRLLHGAIGIATESGELMEALEAHIFKGKELDVANFKEEIGDAFWYFAIICHELGFTFEDIQERNIAKLKERFGDRFSKEKANNRDLDAERKHLE